MSASPDAVIVRVGGPVLLVAVGLVGFFTSRAFDTAAQNDADHTAQLAELSRSIIRIESRLEQLTSQNTIPRAEQELRNQMLAGSIEQVKLRVDNLERRQ